jgi:lipopolysaccharide transport system ATP-binding protein
MSYNVIKVENLSKRYELGLPDRPHDTLRDQLVGGVRSLFRRDLAQANAGAFWALRDVSFEVNQGEIVGVIGRNGTGKSTLLKILSRITEPTEGSADIYGRLGSLLEVGTGFHPELSGRENIYLNGAILGMRKTEIERKFDDIVGFAEVEKFIDVPVKRYSSGMYVRLAFAVAAHLDPEILLVDEVLSVGDAAFQKKCLGKMEDVAREGKTVLFVSHHMASVEHLCTRGVVLQDGRLRFDGPSKEAVNFYLRSMPGNEDRTSTSHIVDLRAAPGRASKCRPLLTRLELYSEGEPVTGTLKIGGALQAHIYFNLEKPTTRVDACLAFDNLFGQRVLTCHSVFEPNHSHGQWCGEAKFICDIPGLTLVAGEYKIKVALDIWNKEEDAIEDATRLTITNADYYGTGRVPWNGYFVLPHHWIVG